MGGIPGLELMGAALGMVRTGMVGNGRIEEGVGIAGWGLYRILFALQCTGDGCELVFKPV